MPRPVLNFASPLLFVACAALLVACDNSLDCATADDCFAGETCYEGSCVPENGGGDNNGNNGNNGTPDGGADDGGTSGPTVVEISAGGLSTCARFASGELRCWGRNGSGELGIGQTSTLESSPQTVADLTNATGLASGHLNHCAYLEGRAAKCWGSDGQEQITTDEDVTAVPTPTDLGVSGIQDLGIADGAICVLLESGAGLTCLGSSSDPVVYAVPEDFPADIESVEADEHHGCAVLVDGDVICWGSESSGELGGSGTVGSLPSVAKVALGFEHSCALSDSGTVYCWGSNASGQLGVGADLNPDGPVRVEELEQIVDISAGYSHTCALDASGGVRCWGADSEGFSQARPTGIFGLNEGVEMISVGSYHACALKEDGGVYCWGRGREGQLGHGSTESSSRPVQVEF